MSGTAKKEQKRISALLKTQGKAVLVPGGPMWHLPKRQFQALYSAVGSYDAALELQPIFLPWPPLDAEGNTHVPPPHWVYAWARAIDAGDEEVDPVLKDRMEKRIDTWFKHQARRTILESGRTVQALAIKARNGELGEKTQVQLLYAANAHNYGLGSMAQYSKAVEGAKGPTISFNGRLSLAPPPRTKTKKIRRDAKKQEQIADAQWREVS